MIDQVRSPWNPRLLWFLLPSLLGGAIWWYVVAQTLQGRLAFTTAGLPTLLVFVIFGVFSFGLWLGALVVGGYPTQSRSIRFVLAGIASLPLLAFFPITMITLGVTFFIWLLLWWASERFVEDAQSRLHVKPHLSAGWAMPVIVTLIMIGVSMLYYQRLQSSSSTPDELGKRLSGQAVEVVERFLPTFIKGYEPDMTVDEVFGLSIPTADVLLQDIHFNQLTNADQREAALRSELERQGIDPNSITLDFNQQQQELESALEQQLEASRLDIARSLQDQLSEQLQVPITGTEPFHDFLVSLVNRQYERYVSNYVAFVPWLLALGLFFILKILTGAFLFVTTWVGWLLVWLYRHLHIIHIAHENVPSEKLEWGK